MKKLRKYIKNNLIAIDQLGNALAGGDPDETISSRIGKNPHCSFLATWLHSFLDWLEPAHCEKSIEKDEGRDGVF